MPSPGLTVPQQLPLPGTAALTAPAPPTCGGCRPRSCCGQSAAKRRPQLGPSAWALAPPIVKGPAGGSAYKASAGYMRPSRCQSRLAIQRGHPEPSNPRPSRAQVQRLLAGPYRVQGSRAVSPGTIPRFTYSESFSTTYHETCLCGNQRSEENTGEIIT